MSRRRHEPRTSAWNSLSAIGPVLRCAIVLRGGSSCAWCGVALTKAEVQIDHVLPRSRGGSNRADNLVPACAGCNHGRDQDAVTVEVRAQLERPIDAALRREARVLARSWYPWFEERARRNRERQAERDAGRSRRR